MSFSQHWCNSWVRFDAAFCETFKKFLDEAPDSLRVLGVPIVDEDKVLVRFCNPDAWDLAVKYCKEWRDLVVVQDGTFDTNHQKLVLHSFSLAGKVVYKGMIRVRALPMQFVLAHREDPWWL